MLERRSSAPPEGALRALFIGSSHTEYHSMPEIASRLAARPLYCESVTHPLRTLEEHWLDPNVQRSLDARPWDAIVLQERTLWPLERFESHLAAVQRFADRARSAGARLVLQRHWPRAAWHKDYVDQHALVGESPRVMFERLRERSEVVRATLGIELAPVGDAWMIALSQTAAQRLYYRGGNHANLAGAILTAHVYATLLCGAPSVAEGFRHEMCWDLSEPLCAWAQAALYTAPATGIEDAQADQRG